MNAVTDEQNDRRGFRQQRLRRDEANNETDGCRKIEKRREFEKKNFHARG
jgi:hypothetical protein